MKHKHLGLVLIILFLLFNDKTEMTFSFNDTWMMEILIVSIVFCVLFVSLKTLDKLKADLGE